MGKRGPAPKPTNVRVLHGDRKDRINAGEPVPAPGGAQIPPEWLPEQARRVWEHYAPDLAAKRVLTAWDSEAFAAWCDAVTRRRRAAAALAEQGEIIEVPVLDRAGEVAGTRVRKNPWTLVLNEADGQLQRYAARFGLTPSDRSQLKIGDAHSEPGDDLLTD